MSSVKLGLSYWMQLFLIPIYFLSFLIPRNPKLWLFGSTFGNRFADNPKYFYLYCNQFHKDRKNGGIRAVWITKQKEIVKLLRKNGYEVYYRYSLKGIWCCLRGKVYIFDNYSKDISFWLSGGAVKINLWHGIPLKKIQKDNCFDQVRNSKKWSDRWRYALRRMTDENPSHYILTTSKKLISIFSSAFGTKRVLTSGYPRNDSLLSEKISNLKTKQEIQDEKRLFKIYQQEKFEKIIFYMPTFRDSEEKFFHIISFERLNRYLLENKYLLCVKLHPKSKLEKKFHELEKEKSPIIVLHSEDDPYIFLKKADMLITDYSSIFFDYLYLNRPLVFFDYDKEEYLTHSRKFYFDYNKITPGKKAETMEELFAAINQGFEYKQEWEEQRLYLKEKIFGSTNELASKKLYSDIINIIK